MRPLSRPIGIELGAPIALALLMALLTLTAFFPGYMSSDTMFQLKEAQTGFYSNLHAPFVAAFWRILLLVWNNPGVLFCVHVVLYWSLWAAFAFLAFQGWKERIFVLGLAALPPLWSQITVVWSDTELSLTLLGAYLFGILAKRSALRTTKKKNIIKSVFLAFSFLLFLYSAAVRQNSLPALIPLAYFMATLAFPKTTRIRATLLACGLCGFGLFFAFFINKFCLQAAPANILQLFETYDLAGVYSQTKREDLIPSYWKNLNPKFTPEMLLKSYTPYSEVPLTFWKEAPVVMTNDPAMLRELRQKWIFAVRLFPLEILRHRWEVSKRLWGVGEPKIFFALYFETVENEFGVKNQGWTELQGPIKRYFTFFRNSLFFRGWIYLLLLLVMIGYQLFKAPSGHPLARPALCSALSAFFYGISYFACPPAAEFRFLYPMVALFFLSLILTLSILTPRRDSR